MTTSDIFINFLHNQWVHQKIENLRMCLPIFVFSRHALHARDNLTFLFSKPPLVKKYTYVFFLVYCYLYNVLLQSLLWVLKIRLSTSGRISLIHGCPNISKHPRFSLFSSSEVDFNSINSTLFPIWPSLLSNCLHKYLHKYIYTYTREYNYQ